MALEFCVSRSQLVTQFQNPYSTAICAVDSRLLALLRSYGTATQIRSGGEGGQGGKPGLGTASHGPFGSRYCFSNRYTKTIRNRSKSNKTNIRGPF